MKNLKIFKASAGSGKTFNLTREYLILILRSEPFYFSRILGMTFTNKAAGEMKESILDSLNTLAENPNRSKHKEALLERIPEFGNDLRKVQEKARRVQKEILLNFQDFSLSTIDSFFQRIVRAFFRELGLASNFDVELNQKQLVSDAITAYLRNMEEGDELIGIINNIQDELVRDKKSPDYRRSLDKLAEELFKEHELPDTRKNKKVLRDIRNQLIKEIKDLDREYKQLKDRVRTQLELYDLHADDFPYKGSSFMSSFFKHEGVAMFKLNLGKRWNEAIGNPDTWTIKSTSDDAKRKIDSVYPELNPVLEQVDFFLKEKEELYRANIELLKNFNSFAALSYINTMIDEYTAENNIFLLSKTYELLRAFITESDSPFIYERIGNHYRHLFIDEFQDTSRYQYENIRPLLSESLATGSENLIVGDVKQAIYRFRNGDWRLLNSHVKMDFDPQVEEISLAENYRSHPNIIVFNNDLYRELGEKLNSAFRAMLKESYPEGLEDGEYGFISEVFGGDAARQNIPENREYHHPGHVQLECMFDEPEEGYEEALMSRLKQQLLELEKAGYSAGDIAMLTRRKSDIQTLIKKLAEWQKEHPGSKIFDFYSEEVLSIADSPAVEMVVSVMRMAAYGRNDYREMQRMWLQLLHFSTKLEVKLFDLESDPSFFIEVPARLPEELIQLIDEGQNQGLYGFFSSIINKLQLGQKALKGQFYYLAGFADEVENYAAKEGNDLIGFLEYWEESGSEKNVQPPSGSNKIQLMTIHKSKGLAFPIVFLPFATDSFMPRWGKNTLWVEDDRFLSEDGKKLEFPISLTQGIRDTKYKKEYWKEIYYNWIDTLNACYVASTRPREALFIYSFNKLSANRAEEFLPYYLSVHAGNSMTSIERDDHPEGLKVYVKDESSLGELKKKTDSKERVSKQVELPTLFSGAQLPEIKSRWVDAKLSSTPSDQRTAIEEGLLMHRILELVIRKRDIPAAILNTVESGQISANEVDHWQNRVERALELEKVRDWFADGIEVLNERDILLPDGSRYRPDRVVLDGKKAILIDYKTGSQRTGYEMQLKTYTDLVVEMGYHSVEGWLFYTDILKAQRVV